MEAVPPDERVKQILSSFVLPKRLDCSSHASTSPFKLQEKEDFQKRVDSYSPLTWFAKPASLAPIQCARYGWINVDEDMLQCVTCKAYTSGKLPQEADPHVYEECLERVTSKLITAHMDFCPWASSPTPETMCTLHWINRKEALAEFVERCSAIKMLGPTNVPIVSEEINENMNIKDNAMKELVEQFEEQKVDQEPDDLKKACVMTSLYGWNADVAASTLVCKYCHRKIGTWNYLTVTQEESVTEIEEEVIEQQTEPLNLCTKAPSVQPKKPVFVFGIHAKIDGSDSGNEDNAETNTDQGEENKEEGRATDNCEVSTEKPTKRQKKLEALNPATEHKSWCPWISEPSAGWKKLLHLLLPSLDSQNVNFAQTLKNKPAHKCATRVRTIFREWERSPTKLLSEAQEQKP